MIVAIIYMNIHVHFILTRVVFILNFYKSVRKISLEDIISYGNSILPNGDNFKLHF